MLKIVLFDSLILCERDPCYVQVLTNQFSAKKDESKTKKVSFTIVVSNGLLKHYKLL